MLTCHNYGRLGHTRPNCFDILYPQFPKIVKIYIWIEKPQLNDYPQTPKFTKIRNIWIEKLKLQSLYTQRFTHLRSIIEVCIND